MTTPSFQDLMFHSQKLPSGIPAEKLAEIRFRGKTLVDKRPQEETGSIHEVDMDQLYGTPDKPGVYKVQLTEGRTEECIVVPTQTGDRLWINSLIPADYTIPEFCPLLRGEPYV